MIRVRKFTPPISAESKQSTHGVLEPVNRPQIRLLIVEQSCRCKPDLFEELLSFWRFPYPSFQPSVVDLNHTGGLKFKIPVSETADYRSDKHG